MYASDDYVELSWEANKTDCEIKLVGVYVHDMAERAVEREWQKKVIRVPANIFQEQGNETWAFNCGIFGLSVCRQRESEMKCRQPCTNVNEHGKTFQPFVVVSLSESVNSRAEAEDGVKCETSLREKSEQKIASRELENYTQLSCWLVGKEVNDRVALQLQCPFHIYKRATFTLQLG